MRRKVSDLGSRLKKIKIPGGRAKKLDEKSKETKAIDIPQETLSITERITNILHKEEDTITKGLFEEARKINEFLESEAIPWLIDSTDKKQSEEIFSKIQSVSNEFWSAITSLVLRDEKGAYDDSLVKAITYLAKLVEPPPGPHIHTGLKMCVITLFLLRYI